MTIKYQSRESDSDLVDRIERFERFRRPIGWVMIAFSFVIACGLLWLWFFGQARDVHNWMVADPILQQHDPEFQEAIRGSYMMGIYLGAFLSFAFLICVEGFLGSIAMLTGGRRERLLVRSFRALQEASDS